MGFQAVRAGVGAVAVLVVTAVAAACSGDPGAEQASPSTAAAEQPRTRPYCETAVPAAWQRAIGGAAVDTGGVSNVPMAVNRRGEVAVSRDKAGARDVLLIGVDKTVTEIYPVPQPDENTVGSVAMDDRWVVVGVQRAPRGANGVTPQLVRVDVVDRQGGPARTVAEVSEQDLERGGKTVDSFTLFGGKVYWITRDGYADDNGTIRSFDLNTGAVTDVASGAMRNVRTTAAGLSWEVAWDQNEGNRVQLKIPDALPPPVAGAVGTGRDQFTLATDGTAYAWFTQSASSEPGVAYWSPDAGLVSITGRFPPVGKYLPTPLFVVGPYVVIDRGRIDQKFDTSTTVIDTRSGALIYLGERVGGANGGSIAVGFGGARKQLPTAAGAVRIAGLPPLSC
ncbi:hypothetical protein DVS77_33750 [Mycolicibacterium moriokaense]|nr:hypothetical protein DVS77_33750 [Mycolicibacterium moriokaense]